MFFFKSYLWSDMRKKSKKYWNKRFGWQTLGFKAFWGLVLVDAQPSDYGCQNAFRTWIEWSNMDFPEFFQRSLLWMVAKSCTTKRKVETCCNPNKSNGMFTIYPLAQDFFHLFTALRCLLREPCRNSTWHMMPLPDSCTNRSRWSTRVRVRRSFRCFIAFIVIFFQQRA